MVSWSTKILNHVGNLDLEGRKHTKECSLQNIGIPQMIEGNFLNRSLLEDLGRSRDPTLLFSAFAGSWREPRGRVGKTHERPTLHSAKQAWNLKKDRLVSSLESSFSGSMMFHVGFGECAISTVRCRQVSLRRNLSISGLDGMSTLVGFEPSLPHGSQKLELGHMSHGFHPVATTIITVYILSTSRRNYPHQTLINTLAHMPPAALIVVARRGTTY